MATRNSIPAYPLSHLRVGALTALLLARTAKQKGRRAEAVALLVFARQLRRRAAQVQP